MQFKFSKSKTNFKKGGMKISPDFFWNILLFVAVVIIIFGAAFGTYLFLKVNKESVFGLDDNPKKSQIISKERISKALEYFSARAKQSNQILTAPPSIIDPSL